LVVLVYSVCPTRWRNEVLLLASLCFYAWGAPVFVFVLIASSALDYIVSKFIQGAKGVHWLWVGVTANVLTLFVFKYFNFFTENVRAIFHVLGFHFPEYAQILLPLGISFFTFQKISYLIDVYRRDTTPATSFANYLLFVSMFPQLIAGPIVRYKDIARQLVNRSENDTAEVKLHGFYLLSLGLAQKVLIADNLAPVVADAFSNEGHTGASWLGLIAFTFQIYFDFSGYSNIAIGLGKLFGFDLPENFRWPYTAIGFRDFWSRWHITLSTWMRDYLYIPLGGNRGTSAKTIRNLWIVFLLSGLWHGASWNFVIWGACHGAFLTLDRLTNGFQVLPRVAIGVLTFALVMLSWVWFRATDLSAALTYYTQLADIIHYRLPEISRVQWAALSVAIVSSFLPSRFQTMVDVSLSERSLWKSVAVVLVSALFIVLVLGQLATSASQPFIYFKF